MAIRFYPHEVKKNDSICYQNTDRDVAHDSKGAYNSGESQSHLRDFSSLNCPRCLAKMIPLKDSIPSRTTPFVNYAMIAACSVVFLMQLSGGDGGRQMVERYGMVPVRVTDPEKPAIIEQDVLYRTPAGIEKRRESRQLADAAVPAMATLLTCIFLHGGWMHFLGNMWFLYIFGDNVEDRLGHIGYLVLYIGTGVAASAAHLISAPESAVPTIGASGAIAGVMGAYMWLYPHSTVLAVIPLFVIMQTIVLPAPVFLGIWFAIQIFQGVVSGAGGVAWWAHIGGFVAGAIVALLVGRTAFAKAPVRARRFDSPGSFSDVIRRRDGQHRYR